MNSNYFSIAGCVLFLGWGFVLARVSITAFGRDLRTDRVKNTLLPRAPKIKQFDRF